MYASTTYKLVEGIKSSKGASGVYKTYMKLQGTESKSERGIPHENLKVTLYGH